MRAISAPARRAGLREALGRAVGNWPVWLHRVGLGRLVGSRYAVVVSVGRRSGRLRRAAVMVLREDSASGEVFVVAGTPSAQWYRNVLARPAAQLWLGGRRFRPEQRLLSTAEVADVLISVRRQHPREARVQALFFGWPWPASEAQLAEMAASIGGVAFRPSGRSGSAAGSPSVTQRAWPPTPRADP